MKMRTKARYEIGDRVRFFTASRGCHCGTVTRVDLYGTMRVENRFGKRARYTVYPYQILETA